MGRTITIPFKIPLSPAFLKRVSTLFNIEIVQKVASASLPGIGLPVATYVHTIPQQKIDAWTAERRAKDSVEALQAQVGFHLKPHGRDGYIYYVDTSRRVCECYYEFSGVPEYDILINVHSLDSWFLPVQQPLSPGEKADIVSAMTSWLAEKKAKAHLY